MTTCAGTNFLFLYLFASTSSPYRLGVALQLSLLLCFFPVTICFSRLAAFSVLASLPALLPQSARSEPTAAPPSPSIIRSNANAMILGQALSRFDPEAAHDLGIMTDFDREVRDLGPGVETRYCAAIREVIRLLSQKLETEGDPQTHEDLTILITEAQRRIHESEARQKSELPYYDVAQIIFSGIDGLLGSTQVEDTSPLLESRRQASLARLRRYAGMEKDGPEALAVLAERRMRECFGQPGLVGPYKAKVERDLAADGQMFEGVVELLKDRGVAGAEPIVAKLKEQLAHHAEFVRQEILPRARADFRLPRERYIAALAAAGIDISPEELIGMAHGGFERAMEEITPLARAVAIEQKLPPDTDWRDVIRALKKKESLLGSAETLDHYHSRARGIDAILRRENLVTLPDAPLRMRLATAAENAGIPAPFFNPTPLFNNPRPGDPGEFVLVTGPGATVANPGARYDDFTYTAASFWVCSHEGRPGHELQFGTMQRNNVSLARSVYAFNSVNVEGWAVYCEALMLPYMPRESQLVALQFRMARAAYAFLDAELQLGKTTPEEAKRVLTQDVGISDAYAASLLRRFTFLAPGQATSYFYGFTRMMELRREVETSQGAKFQARAFHDFILAQGLLPFEEMHKAVETRFSVHPSHK